MSENSFWKKVIPGLKKDDSKGTVYPISIYGKLPVYKDFLSAGLADDGARELRDFLDRSFSHRWSNDEDCKATRIPPHAFCLRLPTSKRVVTGLLWGSTDAGGLRTFPFVLFVSLPPGTDAVSVFDGVGPLLEKAEAVLDRFGGEDTSASVQDFYTASRGAQVTLALRPRKEAAQALADRGADASDFAASLLEDGAASFSSFHREALSAWRRAGVLRVPLGARPSRRSQMGFWLRSLEETPEKRPLVGWLYETAQGRGRASLLSRDLAPDDIFLLHPRRSLGGDVYEIGWPIPEEPVTAAPVALPEVLVEPIVVVPPLAAEPKDAALPSAAAIEHSPAPAPEAAMEPVLESPVPENPESAEKAVIAAMAAGDVAALVVPSPAEPAVSGLESAPEAAPQAETTDRV